MKTWKTWVEKKITSKRLPHRHDQTMPERDSPVEQMLHTSPISTISWVFWGIGLLVVLIGYSVYQMTNILYLIMTGWIVALAIERFIYMRQHIGCSRGFSIGISYLILIVFVLTGAILLVPFIVTQLISLGELIIQAIQAFQGRIYTLGREVVIEQSHLPSIMKGWMLSETTENGNRIVLMQSALDDHMSQLISVGSSSIKSAGSVAVSVINTVFDTLIEIVLVLTVAVFFSLEKNAVNSFLGRVSGRPVYVHHQLQKLSEKLGLRLEGQLLLCVIIGVLVALGLQIVAWFGVDLPSKFSLALIAGFTEFIPYLGPLLGSVPALIIAVIAYGWKGFLVIAVLYRLIQSLENNVIVPLVMSHKLGVSPLVIFLCMLLGASLFGFLGVLLAVPLAVIISILASKEQDVSRNKQLIKEDDVVEQ